MVRKYKRKVGSRKYKNVPPEVLENAVKIVKEGKSMQEISKIYNIPYGTLWNKVKNKHPGNPGHPTALSKNEEQNILKVIDVLTLWREPVSGTDIKFLVKSYLDKKGENIIPFKDNYGTLVMTGYHCS